MELLGQCGFAAPGRLTRCEACHRPIRCVYVLDDGGWWFTLGRSCYQRVIAGEAG